MLLYIWLGSPRLLPSCAHKWGVCPLAEGGCLQLTLIMSLWACKKSVSDPRARGEGCRGRNSSRHYVIESVQQKRQLSANVISLAISKLRRQEGPSGRLIELLFVFFFLWSDLCAADCAQKLYLRRVVQTLQLPHENANRCSLACPARRSACNVNAAKCSW